MCFFAFAEFSVSNSIYLIEHNLLLSGLLVYICVYIYIFFSQYINILFWHLRNNTEFILTSLLHELNISFQKNKVS